MTDAILFIIGLIFKAQRENIESKYRDQNE